MQNLPAVFAVGPQRTGTTWLYEYFRSRGDVCLPKAVKETFFFDRWYDRGETWYQAQFCETSDHRVSAEVGSTYFHNPRVARRIYEFYPEARIVCTLRNPVDRAISLYCHLKRHGLLESPLRDAYKRNEQSLQASSQYAEALSGWLELFGRDRVVVLLLDDLKRDPNEFVNQLCEAVKLPVSDISDELLRPVNQGLSSSGKLSTLAARGSRGLRALGWHWAVNAAKRCGAKRVLEDLARQNDSDESLDKNDRAWLAEQLTGEIERLEQLLDDGRRFNHWIAT